MKLKSIVSMSVMFVVFLAGVVFGCWIVSSERNNKLETLEMQVRDMEGDIILYEKYHSGAERLLDTLDDRYHWSDGYDPEEYYGAVNDLENVGLR